MVISPSNNIYRLALSDEHKLLLNYHSIEFTEVEKLLGVHVDHKLSWNSQVELILKKCTSMLYLLLRIRQFLSTHMRKLFFNAYILPHIDYCCTIWGNCSDTLTNKLYKFQKRAARIILDQPYDAPSHNLFQELKWMKFHDRIIYKKATFVYKSLNNIFPEYMSNLFKESDNISLRSHSNHALCVPKPRLEFCRKSLACSGPVIWNNIPLNIRQSNSLIAFKRLYLSWFYFGGQT